MANEVTVTAMQADTLRIYVPRSRQAVALGSTALVKAQALSGGWTTRYCAGGWVAPDGTVHAEPVDEHEFLVRGDKAQPMRGYLIALAEDLLAAGEQAVLVVVTQGTGITHTYTVTSSKEFP